MGAGAVTGCSCSMEGPGRKRRATDAEGAAQGEGKKGRLCEHQRRRSTCKDCGGSSICEHQRPKSRCKECRSKAADKRGGAHAGLAANLMGAKLLAAKGLDMEELKKEERGGFARGFG